MNSRPLDLRSDPKFLARVKKIESKANTKILIHPIDIPLKNGMTAIIAAIGINGSYLAVIPGMSEDGTWIMPFGHMFSVWWTDKQSTAFEQTEIAKCMSMWIITSEKEDYKEVPHRDIDTVKIAVDVLIAKRGIEYFNFGKSMMTIVDQGVEREIKSPYRQENGK